MSISTSIYERLPVFAQNLACSYRGSQLLRTRYDAAFREQLAWLKESQFWSLQSLRAYQDERLRELITHVYANVPYYGRLMRERGLTPGDIRSAADLPKLPVLTKDLIRANFEDMFSRVHDRRRAVLQHTSGTTGSGLIFYVSKAAYAMQWAVWWRHRSRFGIELGQPHVNFSGQSVVPLRQSRPPFWRENRPLRQTYLSLYHMTPANMPAYVEMLESRQFEYYQGYPSGIYLLADYLRSVNHTLARPPRMIVTGAESLLPFQVQAFERWIGAPATDQYGLGEGCANLSRCEQGHFHDDMEFALIEPQELERRADGRVCRILGTALHNFVMPFIRYDTGDTATFADEPCACGRSTPWARYVDGRVEAYVVTPEGRRIGRMDHCFKDMVNIRESQIVQDDASAIEVLVVKAPAYTDADEHLLQHELRTRLGAAIAIRIRYVAQIPRGSSGKFRAVVSRVAAAQGARELEVYQDQGALS